MNTKNIAKLRDALVRAKYYFNMGTSEFNPKCGSAGCIGGHACLIWPSLIRGAKFSYEFERVFDQCILAERLGMTSDEIHDLCFNPLNVEYETLGYYEVDRAMAIACLNRLVNGEDQIYFDLDDKVQNSDKRIK